MNAARRGTTDALRDMQRGGELDDRVVEKYLAEAKKHALRHLKDGLLRRVSPSDVAAEALPAAIAFLRAKEDTIRSKQEFCAILLRIVRRRAATAARHELAQRRSVDKEVYGEEADLQHNGPSAAQLAIAKELAEQIAAVTAQEDDPVIREIQERYFLDLQTPKEIADGMKHVCSHATVRSCITATKSRLKKVLADWKDTQ